MKQTAVELILKTGSNEFWDNFSEVKKQLENTMIEFAKLHVEAALKASIKEGKCSNGTSVLIKDSILNSYPLENIK